MRIAWTETNIARYRKKHSSKPSQQHKHEDSHHAKGDKPEGKQHKNGYEGQGDYHKDGPSPDYDYKGGYDEHPCSKHIQVKGVTTSYFQDYQYLSPDNNYASGIIHHVLIKGMLALQLCLVSLLPQQRHDILHVCDQRLPPMNASSTTMM